MSDVHVHRTDDVQGDILHVYDGIEEADNRLPRWWLWSFYLAVIFGGFYWLYYQGFQFGKNPMDQFAADRMAMLNTGEPVTKDELTAMVDDKISLSEGKKIYMKVCTRCHGTKGEGKIGPNLTDRYWIGDGSAVGIYETISKGRSGKGMQAWGPTYGRGGVMQITAYVLTIQNTEAKGKAPQGKIWVEPEVEEAPEGATPDGDTPDGDKGSDDATPDGDAATPDEAAAPDPAAPDPATPPDGDPS